jgi:hypothetical protein
MWGVTGGLAACVKALLRLFKAIIALLRLYERCRGGARGACQHRQVVYLACLVIEPS